MAIPCHPPAIRDDLALSEIVPPNLKRFGKSCPLFGDHKLEASSPNHYIILPFSDKPQDLLVLHSRRKELQSNYTTPYVQNQM